MSSEKESIYKPSAWSFGVLNPKSTDEVPGSVLLLPKPYKHNEPLGLQNAAARTSASNFPIAPPTPTAHSGRHSRSTTPSHEQPEFKLNVEPSSAKTKSSTEEKKRTSNGIILEPQPDDSHNDPLNWSKWRRDLALLCLGFYCFIGGGMTPILAAAFTNVSNTYGVSVPQVALTTGFYMLGLGIGGVFASPTAILYGKRPVYLVGAILFVISCVWCAVSPNYASLVVARIFQGIAVSPCEALPSATIAEIYFLHERAYRLGIYTLLLLGGKNLVPLISAAIINSLSWQWVFWIFGMFGAFGGFLLFLFVPETFWDRAPSTRIHHKAFSSSIASAIGHVGNILAPGGAKHSKAAHANAAAKLEPMQEVKLHSLDDNDEQAPEEQLNLSAANAGNVRSKTIAERRRLRTVGFANEPVKESQANEDPMAKIAIDHTDSPRDDHPKSAVGEIYGARTPKTAKFQDEDDQTEPEPPANLATQGRRASEHRDSWRVHPKDAVPKTPDLPDLHNFNSPSYNQVLFPDNTESNIEAQTPQTASSLQTYPSTPAAISYTDHHRTADPKTFRASIKPFNGRLRKESWLRAAIRPFILYAYPSILWSSLIYALSVGWLIVLSESITVVYRNRETYNFSALQCGLVYLSPFIGGVLGTAVAGKISDIIVRWMARRNEGVYEPEFRLIMAGPILISTVIGIMGFGWAVEERDAWIVPTVFFGVISFGCSLGSTTAITFAVDSYRQYAAEALVTLNFSKNVLHGFIFSLFFTGWLESAGSKTVFLVIGGIQVFCLLFTIPMFLFGKRARYATTRLRRLQMN